MKFMFKIFFLLSFTVAISNAMDFATEKVQELEREFINDCKNNLEPHGYYGAMFQACEFSFYQVPEKEDIQYYSEMTSKHLHHQESSSSSSSSCSNAKNLLETPTPILWPFKIAEFMNIDMKNLKDWSSDSSSWSSSDSWDSQDFQEMVETLALWPDQCVAVMPKCYDLNQNTAEMDAALQKLFSNNNDNDDNTSTMIPNGATHVQIDCRADAMELSRIIYATADGIETILPTVAAWTITILLVCLVFFMYCCYGCTWLICFCRRRHDRRSRGNNKNNSEEESFISFAETKDQQQQQQQYEDEATAIFVKEEPFTSTNYVSIVANDNDCYEDDDIELKKTKSLLL